MEFCLILNLKNMEIIYLNETIHVFSKNPSKNSFLLPAHPRTRISGMDWGFWCPGGNWSHSTVLVFEPGVPLWKLFAGIECCYPSTCTCTNELLQSSFSAGLLVCWRRDFSVSLNEIHSNAPVSLKGTRFRPTCEVEINLWFPRWVICALIYCASKQNSNLNLLILPKHLPPVTHRKHIFCLCEVCSTSTDCRWMPVRVFTPSLNKQYRH